MNGDTNGHSGDAPEGKKKDKRLSVERIYQKKSQLEHILLRPDTYIGNILYFDPTIACSFMHLTRLGYSGFGEDVGS